MSIFGKTSGFALRKSTCRNGLIDTKSCIVRQQVRTNGLLLLKSNFSGVEVVWESDRWYDDNGTMERQGVTSNTAVVSRHIDAKRYVVVVHEK